MEIKQFISLSLRIIIALIFLQTLYFKFTAHPDSVYIFQKLGLEPYGRITLGIIELIVSVLVLLPKTKIWGTISSLAIISGALFSHLLVIGTNVKGDEGGLFLLSIIVFVSSVCVLAIHKKDVQILIHSILKSKKTS